MKKIIIINIHSFVDVITNSSTELFVLGDAKSIDAVKEMLQFMLDKWNELAVKGVFGDHYVKNKRFTIGKESKPKPIKTFGNTFGNIFIYTEKKYKQDMKNSPGYGWGYEKKENIGKIFIQGYTDNSIPSEIFDWIEAAFGLTTERYHLG